MYESAAGSERPSEEIPSMTVWPSIARYPIGCQVGRLCDIQVGIGKFFTLGKLAALATIPVSATLFFWRLAPVVARRYTLTDRRIVIRHGLGGDEGESIRLADFDSIAVDILPGQAFFRAGDLVFRSGTEEVFRLAGVHHPEGFRQTCLRGQAALLSVSRAVAEQSGKSEPAVAGGS
jgi:hypothetical protein